MASESSAYDNSVMYGHGFALLAISELLVSGQPLENRTAVAAQAQIAGKFSLHSWQHGVWAAVPPGAGYQTPATIATTFQVMGLMSLFDFGNLDPRSSLRATDAMFEQTHLEGGHHENGTFAPRKPHFTRIFREPVC